MQMYLSLHLGDFRERGYTTKVVFLSGKRDDDFTMNSPKRANSCPKSDKYNRDMVVCEPTDGPAEEMGVLRELERGALSGLARDPLDHHIRPYFHIGKVTEDVSTVKAHRGSSMMCHSC
jgi:hypothetical protein